MKFVVVDHQNEKFQLSLDSTNSAIKTNIGEKIMRQHQGLKRFIILSVLFLCPMLASADGRGGGDQTATIWGVFINNTDACASAPCTEEEVFAEGNPAMTDVCYITGSRVQANGRATFGGRFAEGSYFGCIYSGYGLIDADVAEMHFVVQKHGRANLDYLMDQATAFLGGCPPNDCLDVHFSIHVADGEFESVSDVYRFKDGSQVRGATSTLRRFAYGIKVAINTRLNDGRDHYEPCE